MSHEASNRIDTLPRILTKYRDIVDRSLQLQLSGGDSKIQNILRYSMGWTTPDGNPEKSTTGKCLRPSLCLFACEANHGEIEKALPAAISLELVHRFSLIHDDIQDHDETRHNRPTVWNIWGEPTALISGNSLRAIAALCLNMLVDQGVTYTTATRVSRLLTQASLEMIEGQYLDIAYEGRHDIGLDAYLDMIQKKTGALIMCSVVSGSILADGDHKTVKAFEECSKSLGLLFQIRDDALGLWGNEHITGKPVISDVRRKKNTLPVIYAMSKVDSTYSDLLAETYRKPFLDDNDVIVVLDIIDKLGAKEYVAELAEYHYRATIDTLAGIGLDSDIQKDVKELAQFLLYREH